MATFHSQKSRRSGSTLLLALWALLLLSAVVLGWAKVIDGGIAWAFQGNQELEARALAQSGLAVGLNPVVTRYSSPVLNSSFGEDRSYHVAIISEGGKLNINFLLAGEDPNRINVLKKYLALRGVNMHDREVLVDSMLDWVGPQTVMRRPNGMQEKLDYHPTHKPFASIEEIAQVNGSGPLISLPSWKEDLTIVSKGPLDAETASAEFLALMPGIDLPRATRFVKFRQGKDLQEGTEDDYEFQDMNEVLSYLGITQEQFNQMFGLLQFRDPIFRILSTGKAGKVERQVEVFARKTPGANPEIIEWIQK